MKDSEVFGRLYCAIGTFQQKFCGIECRANPDGAIPYIQITKDAWYFNSSFTKGWSNVDYGFLVDE